MKKNIIIASSVILLSGLIGIGSLVAFDQNGRSPSLVSGTGYELALSSANVLETGTTPSGIKTGSVKTAQNNAIEFGYSGLYVLASGFQAIDFGGYLENTSPISGMSSLSFTLAEGSAPVSLSYGWKAANDFQVSGQSVTESAVFSFGTEAPSYIRLDNASLTDPILLTSLSVSYSCVAQANPYSIDGMSFTRSGNSVKLASFEGSETSVIVPSSVGDYEVTSIASQALKDQTGVLSAYIPETVTTIGADAFNGCSNLTIYTPFAEVQAGWDSDWNSSSRPVRYETFDKDVVVTGSIPANDYAFEGFKASSGSFVFGLDKGTASDFAIVEDGIVGPSLHFASNGSYGGGYLNNPSFFYQANTKYRIEFDYRLLSLTDTIYFQLSRDGANVYEQFGSVGEIGSTVHFSKVYTLGNYSDYVVQIFPGGGNGTTEFLLDNLKITNVDPFAYVGGYVYETMDESDRSMSIDLSPTSGTSYIASGENAISGNSLFMVSSGDYLGFYLKVTGKWAVATYTFSCSYRVVSIADGGTVYFKAYASTIVDPNMSPVCDGEIHTYSYSFTHATTDNVVMQIFPNAAATVVFDNFKVLRTA